MSSKGRPRYEASCREVPLHGMAEADMGNAGTAGHGGAIHRHGIGVVEQQAVRRPDLGDVPGDVNHDRNCPQGAENAADAERVADGLEQAVFARDFEINHRARLVTADLHGADHVARALDRRALVERGDDPGLHAQHGNHPVRHQFGHLEPRRVDVHQAKRGVRKFRKLENVADQVLGEDDRAGSDQGDF